MAIDPKQLMVQFRNITTGMAKAVAGDDGVALIRIITKSLDKTLAMIDKYLTVGVDKAQEYYEQSREKIGSYKGKGEAQFKELRGDIKDKGLWAVAKERSSQVKGKLSDAFKSDTEGAQAPPNDPSAKEAGPLAAVVSSIQSLKGSIVALTQTNQESLQHDVARDASEDKERTREQSKARGEASHRKLLDRMTRRGKEVQEEKDGARVKKKESKSMFGGILGGVITAIGAVSKTIVFGTKMLLKGLPLLLGKTLMLSLKSLGLGGAAAGLLGKLGSGAASVARAAAPGLMAGLKVAGRVALHVGGRAVLALGGTALVGVAAAGLAIYGGYKLYKYLTRNSLGDGMKGKMTRLRMLSYGFNDVHREHYNKLLELDMLMKESVVNKDGIATYKKFDKTFRDKVISIFEVRRDETAKYKILNDWFMRRYLAAHKAFMTAYYSAGGTTYLDDLEKLSDAQCLEFASTYRLPEAVYECAMIPVFDSPEVLVKKDEIDALLLSLRQEGKTKSETHKGEDPAETQRKALKKSADEAAKQKLANDRLNAVVTAKVQGTEPPGAPSTGSVADTPQRGIDFNKVNVLRGSGPSVPEPQSGNTGQEEGETTPPTPAKTAEDKPLQTTVDKVSKAPGPLATPSSSLEGMKGNAPRDRIMSLDPNVLQLFSGMTKEYMELTGKKISVNEAFRTRADQEEMRRKKGEGAAKPGTSLHEFGLAIDISSADADLLDKMGLMRKYGFTRPISGETWHIEPAGVSTDPQAAKKDLGLRAQRIASSPGRGGGGFGNRYNVPDKEKYRRNIPLQKKLFDAGESLDLPVNPRESAEADKPVAATPQVVAKQEAQQASPPAPSSAMTPGYMDALNKANADASAPAAAPKLDRGGMDISRFGISSDPEPSQTVPRLQQPGTVPLSPVAPKLDRGGMDISRFGISSEPEPSQTVPRLHQLGVVPLSPVAPKGLDTSTSQLNTPQSNLDPGKFSELPPKQAVIQAAKLVGMNPDTMLAFAQIESSMRPGVRAKTSSATGLFQITDGTWGDLMRKYGARYNVPANAKSTDAYYNAVLGAAYAKENLSALGGSAATGIREDTLLYLGHHFGAGGARSIVRGFKQNPGAPIQSVVSAAAFSANRQELSGKTSAQYIQYLDNKLSKAGSAAGASPTAQKPVGGEPVSVSAAGASPTAQKPVGGEPVSGSAPSSVAQARNEGGTPERYDADAEEDAYFEAKGNAQSASTGQSSAPALEVRKGSVVAGPYPLSTSTQSPDPLSSFKDRIAAMGKLPVPQPGIVTPSLKQSITDAISRPHLDHSPQSQQPSAALSLDKTDSILTSMGDTLVQIRNILQGISEKSSTMTGAADTSSATAANTSSTGVPMTATMDRMPSNKGISMSRRSVL